MPLHAATLSGVPQIINDERRGSAPVWVAAETAVAAGTIRADLLAHHAGSLRRNARLNGGAAAGDRKQAANANAGLAARPCRAYMGALPSHFEPTSSTNDLAKYADVIVAGRARAMTTGFLQGMPGTLISLSPTYVKGADSDEILLFYPLARIETADGPICTKPVAEFVQPQLGDRFLVFSMLAPLVVDGRTILVVNIARELVHEPQGKPALIPAALRDDISGIDDAQRQLERVFNPSTRPR